MMESYGLLIIFPAAFLLDIILGDPLFLPHPIRWMGKAIELLEPAFRKNSKNLSVSGTFFALFLISSAWAITFIIVVIVGCTYLLVHFSKIAETIGNGSRQITYGQQNRRSKSKGFPHRGQRC